jgi:hypothetical protein
MSSSDYSPLLLSPPRPPRFPLALSRSLSNPPPFTVQGLNLNRFYDDPDPARHPTIWAVRRLLVALSESTAVTGRLKYYVDLHAHATKRGAFCYANALPHYAQQVPRGGGWAWRHKGGGYTAASRAAVARKPAWLACPAASTPILYARLRRPPPPSPLSL